jgi:hypothetical protein
VSPSHATQFRAFIKQIRNRYELSSIIKGTQKWPDKPEDRDALYFLAQSFKAQLVKELTSDKSKLSGTSQVLAYRAKTMIKDLAGICLEIAQMAVSAEDDCALPDWFVVEVIRDLPRLAAKK